jgi:phage major head subunit gpT-like protein
VDVTPDTLQALYYSFSLLFQQTREHTPVFYRQLALEVPSSTSENRYPWMASIPKVREWLGERVLHGVAARAYTLANRKFELSIKLERDRIEDNQIALFTPTLQLFAQEVAKWPDDLLMELLKNAQTQACWDGQPFFHAAHPVNPDKASAGTYGNLYLSKPLTPANYDEVRREMFVRKDENGRILRVTPSHLVVPPALETAARQILNADMVAPGTAVGTNAAGAHQQNVLKGSAQLMVIPELSELPDGDGTWMLLDLTKPIKPFLFQLRRSPEFKALDSPTSENVIMREEYIYASDMRGNCGFGLPFLASKAKAAAS